MTRSIATLPLRVIVITSPRTSAMLQRPLWLSTWTRPSVRAICTRPLREMTRTAVCSGTRTL